MTPPLLSTALTPPRHAPPNPIPSPQPYSPPPKTNTQTNLHYSYWGYGKEYTKDASAEAYKALVEAGLNFIDTVRATHRPATAR